jgi:outer membrane protein assembly factor BamA
MKMKGLAVSMTLVGLLASPTLGRAQEGQAGKDGATIERIDVLNNQFLQRETLLYYVATKAGDPYDDARLKDDFRRLWDTGFLEDLQLDVVDGQTGKIVRFRVVERKRIQIVDFRGSKELTTTTIEDELKKQDAKIKLDTFYDITKARRVEAIIREMLLAKGRPFATVRHENKNVGGAGEAQGNRLRRQLGRQRQQAPKPDEEDQARRFLEPELGRREVDLHRREVERWRG